MDIPIYYARISDYHHLITLQYSNKYGTCNLHVILVPHGEQIINSCLFMLPCLRLFLTIKYYLVSSGPCCSSQSRPSFQVNRSSGPRRTMSLLLFIFCSISVSYFMFLSNIITTMRIFYLVETPL